MAIFFLDFSIFFMASILRLVKNKFEYFFGEDQGRYIIEIESSKVNKVNDLLKKNSVHFDDLGIIEDNNLSFNGEINLPIEDLAKTHKYWLKGYMEN